MKILVLDFDENLSGDELIDSFLEQLKSEHGAEIGTHLLNLVQWDLQKQSRDKTKIGERKD